MWICMYVCMYIYIQDRLCGLVVRVSGYRYRGPGFDPRRYQWVWNGVHSASWASWDQLRSYLNEKSSGSRSRKQRLTAGGTRCADHVTPLYPQKLALTSPTGGGRSVGIVRVRTKATELYRHTECFIMFSVITNIYNKKNQEPTLVKLFIATGKLKRGFFFLQLEMFDVCNTGDKAHIDAIFRFFSG